MTSTLAWLEAYPGGEAALSLVIEGIPHVFSTSPASEMVGTFSGAGAPYNSFNDPRGGLYVGGQLKQAIKLYAPDIEPEQLDFRILDYDGVLTQQILREGNSSGQRTYIINNVYAGSTADIGVYNTTGFAASGDVYLGHECIGYTSKTLGLFKGITRAKYTLNQTNGGTAFSPSYVIPAGVSDASLFPSITSWPRTWYGRFVHLLWHMKDPTTGQFNSAAEAVKVWSGRIGSYEDNGDASIRISATSASELLNRPLAQDQWVARINEGLYLSTSKDTIIITSDLAPAYWPEATLPGFNARKSHQDIAEAISKQFRDWNAAVTTRAGDMWSLSLEDTAVGPRYVFRLRANSTALTDATNCSVQLHQDVWRLLGWTSPAQKSTAGTSKEQLQARWLTYKKTSSEMELIGEVAPLVYQFDDIILGSDFSLSDEANTFVTQNLSELNVGSANGVVQISGGGTLDATYAVRYTSGRITIYGQLNEDTGTFRYPGDDKTLSANDVRMDSSREAPVVKQVWYQRGSAGTILLKCLLSTGGSVGYNHATYDYFGNSQPGFGASVPASLIDVESFEALNDVQISMLVRDQRPFYEYLEPILAVSGRYVVWKARGTAVQPKLTVVRPSLETTYQASWALSESNKAGATLDDPDRVRVTRAADGVINRMEVTYGGAESNAVTLTVDHLASQSDYGRKRTVKIKAKNVVNAEEVVDKTLSPGLAYFSRPLAIAERSINGSLFRMAPGDTASLTDSYVANPATGVRDGSPIYCWVLGTSFDLATGRGQANLVFLPEKDFTRAGKLAPSVFVDNTAGGGGYDGASTLTLRTHEFSSASDSADARRFVNGDSIHIYQLDSAAPLEWFRTVSGTPTDTTLSFSGGVLAGWVAGNRYVVEYDDISTVANSDQRQSAFLADATSESTGYVTNPAPYQWGQRQSLAQGAVVDYDTGMFRPNSTYANQGEPMSIHKLHLLVRGANNLLRYRSRQVILNNYMVSDHSGTSMQLVFATWVPLYGHTRADGNRNFVVRIRGRVNAGTGTITVCSSPNLPYGNTLVASTMPYLFADAGVVQWQTTSVTHTWSNELSLSVQPGPSAHAGLPGTWITVWTQNSGANITYTAGLSIAEAVS